MEKKMEKLKLAVLISGGGTTLINFIRNIEDDMLNANIVGVISSLKPCKKNERVLVKCNEKNIPVSFVVRSEFKSKEKFWEKQNEILDIFKPKLIALAGYLKFWKIPDRYLGKVINIHPALLPKFGGKGFYGMRVHEAVFEAGEKESGCTIHFANNKYDSGPIILQKIVRILPDETPKTLQKRIFKLECIAYPEVINLFAREAITLITDNELIDGKVIIN